MARLANNPPIREAYMKNIMRVIKALIVIGVVLTAFAYALCLALAALGMAN